MPKPAKPSADAARRAEEERQRREHEAARGSYTLEDLQRMRDEVAAQVARRRHHVKTEAERELWRRRAERLRADIADDESKAAIARA